jgi:hypothetical protein
LIKKYTESQNNPERNKKKERKSKAPKKSKSKFASSSMQQSSYTEEDFVEAAIPDRDPQENVQAMKSEETNKKQPLINFPREREISFCKNLESPANPPQYLQKNLGQPQYFNGIVLGPENMIPNYGVGNSPILNAYNKATLPIEHRSAPLVKVPPGQRKPPFTRSGTHLAIAYYIHFSKKKSLIPVKFLYYIF